MKYRFIEVPLYQGCDNRGVEKAPEILSKHIKTTKEHEFINVIGYDNDVSERYLDSSIIRYKSVIEKVNSELAKAVYQALKEGYFPITIGGDHALAIGSIAGVSKFYPYEDLSVIWFDAHTDVNTPESSPSHNAHGMPLAHHLGLTHFDLDEAFNRDINLLPSNLHYFAVRSIDEGEQLTLEKLDIFHLLTKEVQSLGIKEASNKLIESIKGKYVHLSFDLDVIDPKIFYATGVREVDGLTVEEVKEALSILIPSLPIVSVDFVEYHPQLDDGGNRPIASDILNLIIELLEQK